MSFYEIEHGVEFPRKVRGFWMKLGNSMNIGDSVKVRNMQEKQSLLNAFRRLEFQGRSSLMTKDGEQFYRVWRVG